METRNSFLFSKALAQLLRLYGPNASFREGQYEAIEATLTRRRTLVVQRTGWGKSLVYFIATRLLRGDGKGLTLVVSPLLALMQNQMDAAKKLGLTCDALNHQTRDRREEILGSMANGTLDLVLVTPETLFAQDVQSMLPRIRIGLFVIDEAHCISDWGHDFRLEYSRLREIIQQLPRAVPVLATTATANDRVINDLTAQLGQDVYVSRGPLTRESLWIQIMNLPNRIDRYAWLLENVPKLPGSGIIYCLTQRDCDYISDFLNRHGIAAMSYYSRDGEEEQKNVEAEKRFQNNRIKALVATVKLGMGYDKGDIAFVIHFQMPSNIVSYYQQIGRAGRNIDRAYAVLMHGEEDEEIIEYFIRTAFPSEQETDAIRAALSYGGMRLSDLEQRLNMRHARIEKALSFLQNDGYIYREKQMYYASPKPYRYDREHYDAIRSIRRSEMRQMHSLVRTGECYSKFIVSALDDPTARACGHCANCLGRAILPTTPGFGSQRIAAEYVDGLILPIEPRKRWAAFEGRTASRIQYQNQPGLCLSKYGDPGYGALVKQGKYARPPHFADELVGKSARLLMPLILEEQITHITCVPSLRSDIVQDFACRLADRCGLTFVELLDKRTASPQKTMENSAHQCENAYRSFSVREGATMPKHVLLVDDIVDSRWTLTVCGYRLMENGCSKVYPFALADSSHKEY